MERLARAGCRRGRLRQGASPAIVSHGDDAAGVVHDDVDGFHGWVALQVVGGVDQDLIEILGSAGMNVTSR